MSLYIKIDNISIHTTFIMDTALNLVTNMDNCTVSIYRMQTLDDY